MAPETDLDRVLSAFVQDHRDGWTHDEWASLLWTLEERGHDVSNPDAVGLELERQRVLTILQTVAVPGLGPKRRAAIADRFPRLWDLREASVDDLAGLPSVTSGIAARLRAALH